MSNRDKNIKVIFLITCATFFGKILGVLRDCLLSYYFGTTSETDAFFLALSIPTILLGVFTASTDSAVIPQYKRVCFESSKETADQLFSSIVNFLSIIAFIVSVIILVQPSIFVKIFAMGFNKETVLIANDYLRIFSFVGLLHLLYCFLCTYNAAHKKNTVRTILAFSTNFIVSFVLIFFHNDLKYIAYAYLIANLVCAVLPVYEMKKLQYHHTFKIKVIDKEFKKFWVLFVPIMGGALLADIQQYVDKNLGSSIIGGISYLNYGNKLITIFDSIFVVGIAVVLLPMLSDLENNRKSESYSKICSKVTRLLIEILLPFMTIIMILSKEFIMLLYGRGRFNETSVLIVADVLEAYSPLILLIPLMTIFSKYFHAKELNRIPFIINLIGVIINIILSIVLKGIFGLVGIALATTIATIIEVVLFVIIISIKIQWDKSELGLRHLLLIFIPFILCLVLYYFRIKTFHNYLLSIIINSAIIGGIFFISYLFFMRKDVLYWLNKVVGIIKR